MKQLSFQQLLAVPILDGALYPNPGGPTVVWSTAAGTPLLWNGTNWSSLITDVDLKALESLTTTGFVVRTGSGTAATRVIAGTPGQIQVFDSDGVNNSPSIALVNTGVSPGTYPKVTVDAQGRVTAAGPLVGADIPTDYLRLFKENYTTGADATASGNNGVAIGNGASAQAANSIALGEQSVTRHHGALMQSAGRYTVSGDAQVGSYIMKAVTTSNLPKFMYLDGPTGTTPLQLPDNSTWTYKITITAHRADINDARAGYFAKGMIFRQSGAGSTALQGFPAIEVISETNSIWNINISADNVNGCLSIMVTGESSKTIRWLAHVETVEITS